VELGFESRALSQDTSLTLGEWKADGGDQPRPQASLLSVGAAMAQCAVPRKQNTAYLDFML
jgi:hypothetical protein